MALSNKLSVVSDRVEPSFGRPALAAEVKAVEFSAELWAAINGGWGLPTKSGEQVSNATAVQVTSFYRAMLVIAEGIAQLPVEIYRSLSSGRGAEPAIDHPLYDLLLHQANNLQDAFQFFRTTLMHAAGAGNGISYKVVVNGQIRELIPIRPECVSIRQPDLFNRVLLDVTFEHGGYATVDRDQVFHIAGPSWSPYKGLEPAVVGREALGLAQATAASQARFHANGTKPSGVLSTEQKLTQEYVDKLRAQWRSVNGGPDNNGGLLVTSGGLKWQQMQMTGVDAEHLNTRKHQIEEIARLMGVFPIMLGHAGDQTPTFASADAFLEAHVRYGLQPWIKAVRSAVESQLLTKEERAAGYHCRIDTSELLRGSLKDRTEYYKAALGTNSSPGWLKPNEIREDDGWNPDDDAKMDKVWQPATMAPVDAETPTGGAPDGQPEGTKATPRSLYICRKLLNSAEFLRWAKAQGFTKTLDAGDLHVTIAYSRTAVDWIAIGEPWNSDRDGGLVVRAGGPRVVERLGREGAVVLMFASSELSWRHISIREAGASWDYSEYQPHVTITYEAGDIDLAKIEPYRGELRFGPEIFQEIDESWRDRADGDRNRE